MGTEFEMVAYKIPTLVSYSIPSSVRSNFLMEMDSKSVNWVTYFQRMIYV